MLLSFVQRFLVLFVATSVLLSVSHSCPVRVVLVVCGVLFQVACAVFGCCGASVSVLLCVFLCWAPPLLWLVMPICLRLCMTRFGNEEYFSRALEWVYSPFLFCVVWEGWIHVCSK